MKKIIIMVVVGVVVLVAGILGGIFLGPKLFPSSSETTTGVDVPALGPLVDLGQLQSTLADPEMHIVRVRVLVELSSPEALAALADQGWTARMRDEVLTTLRDQRYDNIRFNEGIEKLRLDVKSRLNVILPRAGDELAVRNIIFDEYMTQ